MEGILINQDAIMAVLPNSKDEAKSLREIAQDMGIELNSYVD